MLRPFRLILTGLALFVVAAGAGVLVVSHWGPERTRAVLELGLAEALDRPVEVRAARIYFPGGPLSWLQGVLLDAEGIEHHVSPETLDVMQRLTGEFRKTKKRASGKTGS